MIKCTVSLAHICLALATTTLNGQTAFQRHFTGDTLRADLTLSRHGSTVGFAIQELRKEGAWAGSHKRMLDTLNLGQYLVLVNDIPTNRPLYSVGLWMGSPEDDHSFMSVRIPFPRKTVQLVVKRRNADNVGFQEVWNTTIDPESFQIRQAHPDPTWVHQDLFVHGPPADKIDIAILGDGYTHHEQAKFNRDAKRASEFLFSVSPFDERKSAFNVRTVFAASPETNVSDPRLGIWRRTAFECTYNHRGTDYWLVARDEAALFDAASIVPYDYIILIANSPKYGGSGEYRSTVVAAIDSKMAKHLVVHEFGHCFAGLGDEYYVQTTSHTKTTHALIEPWEPNITTEVHRKKLKWATFIHDDTPVPTKWSKESYERLYLGLIAQGRRIREKPNYNAELEDALYAMCTTTSDALGAEPFVGKVGAFEGALGRSQGYYRPQIDCLMFTIQTGSMKFCRVCNAACQRVIDSHVNPEGRPTN